MKEQFIHIFQDTISLYKKFVHWNISKVVINVASFGLSLLLSLPVLVVLALIMYFDSIAWLEVVSNYVSSGSLGLSVIAELSNHLFLIIFEGILLLIAGFLFLLGYSYKNLLISNLYLKYLDGEQIPYLKNAYFDIQKIIAYVKVINLIALVLLIPVVIFVISFFVLIFAFGGVENAFKIVDSGTTNYFSVALFISLFLNILIFVYLAYRMSFSYIILMDNKNYPHMQPASFYLKESFTVSKGTKIFKFILVLIVFTIAMFPVDYVGEKIQAFHQVFVTFYGIIVFLLLGGVFEMLIVSLYRRVMLGKNQEIKQEITIPVEDKKVAETEVL